MNGRRRRDTSRFCTAAQTGEGKGRSYGNGDTKARRGEEGHFRSGRRVDERLGARPSLHAHPGYRVQSRGERSVARCRPGGLYIEGTACKRSERSAIPPIRLTVRSRALSARLSGRARLCLGNRARSRSRVSPRSHALRLLKRASSCSSPSLCFSSRSFCRMSSDALVCTKRR